MTQIDMLTDPASELVEFAELLIKLPGDQTIFYSVLSSFAGLNERGPDIYFLLKILNSRIENLRNFAERTDDKHMTPRLQRVIMQGIGSYTNAFSIPTLNLPFLLIKQQVLNDAALANMQALSAIVSKHYPLKRLRSEDFEQYTQDLKELAHSISTDDQIPHWARSSLIEAIAQLRWTLDRIHIFGIEIALDQLTLITSRTQALGGDLVASGVTPATSLGSLFRLLEVVVVIGHAFCLPADVPEHLHTYQRWLRGPVQEQLTSPEQPFRLLTSPSPELQNNNDTAVSSTTAS